MNQYPKRRDPMAFTKAIAKTNPSKEMEKLNNEDPDSLDGRIKPEK